MCMFPIEDGTILGDPTDINTASKEYYEYLYKSEYLDSLEEQNKF